MHRYLPMTAPEAEVQTPVAIDMASPTAEEEHQALEVGRVLVA